MFKFSFKKDNSFFYAQVLLREREVFFFIFFLANRVYFFSVEILWNSTETKMCVCVFGYSNCHPEVSCLPACLFGRQGAREGGWCLHRLTQPSAPDSGVTGRAVQCCAATATQTDPAHAFLSDSATTYSSQLGPEPHCLYSKPSNHCAVSCEL